MYDVETTRAFGVIFGVALSFVADEYVVLFE